MMTSPNKSKSYLLPLYDYYVIKITHFDDIDNTYCFTTDIELFTIVYNSSDILFYKEYYKDHANVNQSNDKIYVTFEKDCRFEKDYDLADFRRSGLSIPVA